jgi:hypothetical protein
MTAFMHPPSRSLLRQFRRRTLAQSIEQAHFRHFECVTSGLSKKNLSRKPRVRCTSIVGPESRLSDDFLLLRAIKVQPSPHERKSPEKMIIDDHCSFGNECRVHFRCGRSPHVLSIIQLGDRSLVPDSHLREEP